MSQTNYIIISADYIGYQDCSANETANNEGWVYVNGSTLRLCNRRTVTNSNDPGYPGEVCFDSNYIYFCVATDTWKRLLMSSW